MTTDSRKISFDAIWGGCIPIVISDRWTTPKLFSSRFYHDSIMIIYHGYDERGYSKCLGHDISDANLVARNR